MQQKLFQKVGDVRNGASALLTRCRSYAARGGIDESLEAARAAEALFLQANDRRGAASALHMIAEVSAVDLRFAASFKAATKMRKVLEEACDTRFLLSALRLIATLHIRMGEDEEAVKVAKEMQLASKRVDGKRVKAESFVFLSQVQTAVILHELEKMPGAEKEAKIVSVADRAFKPAQDGVTFARKLGDRTLTASAVHQLGEVCLLVRRFHEALECASECLTLFNDHGDKSGAAASLLLGAEVHFCTGRREKAIEVASKARDLAVECNDLITEERAESLLTRMQGQPKSTVPSSIEELENKVSVPDTGPTAQPKKGFTHDDARAIVLKNAVESIGEDVAVEFDAPLMDMGLDSLAAVSFRNSLQKEVDMRLPGTILFDYPTPRALVDYLVEHGAEE